MVERPVRLHVDEPAALGPDDAGECRDLVQDGSSQVVGGHRHGAAAEPDQVGIPGMGADGRPGLEREAYRAAHRERVAGVEAAGDVD